MIRLCFANDARTPARFLRWPISAVLRGQLDEELARQDDSQRIVRVMKTERAISISASQGLFTEAWWLPWLGKGLQLDMLDFYDRLLPVVARPWHESHHEIDRLDNVIHRTMVSATLIELLQPALLASHEAESRSTALLRSLRIINRLTAYAQENGHEASDLADLDLPKSATLDPYSGETLKLKWTEGGWVVYTVFRDGTDDGGDFRDMADWGLAPAGYPGAD